MPGENTRKKRESGEISEEEKVSKSEERPSPQIPLKSEGTRNRKNGRPLRFQRNLRGPEIGGPDLCRRKSQAIFDGRGRVPRKFIEFSGDNEKKIFDEGGPIEDRAPRFDLSFPEIEKVFPESVLPENGMPFSGGTGA